MPRISPLPPCTHKKEEQKLIHNAFITLEAALKTTLLPTEKGKPRQASAHEFMFMQTTEAGDHQFKHAHSRNYVIIDSSGKLLVPQTKEPFLRGTFDL